MASPEQLEENGQYDLAYEEYTKLYKNNPKNTHLLERLGHIASILNKKDDAEFFYTELIRLDAKNLMAYEQLMDICHDTNRYKYYVCKGEMHVLQEQIEHAINDYKKAVEKADLEKQSTLIETELRQEIIAFKEKYNDASKQLEDVKDKIKEYENQVDSNADAVEIVSNELKQTTQLLGKTNVKGDGIVVTLEDNSQEKIVESDLSEITNELKYAGAEAISINGIRLTPLMDVTSTSNNIILLNGQKISSPYVVKAIRRPKIFI